MVGMTVLLLTMWRGPLIMAASNVLISLLNQVINSWPNRRLLGYSYKDQLLDIMPSVIISVIMFLIVWSLQRIIINPLLLIVLQIPVGIGVYIMGSILIHNESFFYICNTLREIAAVRELKKHQ